MTPLYAQWVKTWDMGYPVIYTELLFERDDIQPYCTMLRPLNKRAKSVTINCVKRPVKWLPNTGNRSK